jgi:hypothetical protein
VITMPSYRLGAEELVELGRARNAEAQGRRPFFQSRLSGRAMGDILDVVKSVGGFISSGLGFALNTLGDLLDVPLGILSQGVDITFNGVVGLLENIPIIGDLLAEIMVLGGAVIKFALSVPGLVLHGVGNILSGIGKALSAKNSASENEKKVKEAKDNIVNKAPAGAKEKVREVLESTGVTGDNLMPNAVPGETPAAVGLSDLEKGLLVGIPAVGILAVVLLSK